MALVLLMALMLMPAIQRDLPYANDFDEPVYVQAAVRMATTGDLNPGWFGHPGSTVIYPLTALYHTWFAVTQHGQLLHADIKLQYYFDSGDAWEYYLLGRLLSVSYTLLAVPLIYKLGAHVFGRRTAFAGTLLYIFYPLMIFYSRMVRTDSAATFYGILCLWRCMRLYKKPSLQNSYLAGLALGLAVATRYFMAAFFVVYLGIHALHYFNPSSRVSHRMIIRDLLGGLAMMGLAFALSSPYFFLNFRTVLHDFQVESRSANLGYDGLSPPGNLLWYLTTGLPRVATWPPMLWAAIGFGLMLWRRNALHRLLAGFVAVYLLTISLPALHWPRWTLQIQPLLALMAVFAVRQLLLGLVSKGHYTQCVQRFLFMTGMLAILILPVYRTIALNISWSHFSTRITMAEWVKEHIPPGSLVLMETFKMAVDIPGSRIQEVGTLGELGISLDALVAQDYSYVILNQERYGRYYAEPERYPEAIRFYETIFKEAILIQEFHNSATQPGPNIQIYKLVQ